MKSKFLNKSKRGGIESIKKIIFIFTFLLIMSLIFYNILKPVIYSSEIIITYGIEPFDIVSTYPEAWKYLKIIYVATFLFSNIVYANFVFLKKKLKSNLN